MGRGRRGTPYPPLDFAVDHRFFYFLTLTGDLKKCNSHELAGPHFGPVLLGGGLVGLGLCSRLLVLGREDTAEASGPLPGPGREQKQRLSLWGQRGQGPGMREENQREHGVTSAPECS